MRRGQLRIYLGAAPGVGKTYAMLNEGRRRRERGTDVVVGFAEPYGRALTIAQLAGLEVVGPQVVSDAAGVSRDELDLDGLLARRPAVALVDELAHANAPGGRHAKRWEDVAELLDAGIDVVSTLNIEHLESLGDVVASITGIAPRTTVPDEFVRSAEQIELVDATPEALRRRMAHGNIYPADRIDAALSDYFRVGNLAALRELALTWLASEVDDAVTQYRSSHGIVEPWETRERVVVALTGAPHGDALVRRAARIATRVHGELIGVHVRGASGLRPGANGAIEGQRKLLADLGGEYHEVAGVEVARSLVAFAQSHNATQIVLGASRRSWWARVTGGSVINDVLRRSGRIDVHVISTEALDGDGDARSIAPAVAPRARAGHAVFSRRRRSIAWALAVAAPLLLTAVLTHITRHATLTTDLLLYLVLVVAIAATGGVGPAACAAVGSFLLANFFLTPPLHHWTVAEPHNVVALLIFVTVAIVVGWFVSEAARQRVDAARARSEAETLAALAATVGSDDDPLPEVAEQLRSALGATAVSVLRLGPDGWRVEASAGDEPPTSRADADLALPLGKSGVIALRGADPESLDVPTLAAFVNQTGTALERRQLRAEAARAVALSKVDDLRAALLAAVSHDLRTPLASIKASVSTLRNPTIEWSAADRAELLETIELGTDRLTELITNLLGMSRIHAGTVVLATRPVAIETTVALAESSFDPRGHEIVLDLAPDLPDVRADAALLERVLANLLDNACKWSPPGCPVVVRASAHRDRVLTMVIDRGPGIRPDDRPQVFEPFQRVGDSATGPAGTGLGLAVARGFVELMEGALVIEDTPGGGTTMVVDLPVAGDRV